MKDFEEFVGFYTERGTASESVKVAREAAGVDADSRFPEGMEGYIIALSARMSLDMMRDYHEWVSS